jgi:hypothetical protein
MAALLGVLPAQTDRALSPDVAESKTQKTRPDEPDVTKFFRSRLISLYAMTLLV